MTRDDIIRMAREVGAGEPESLFGRTDYVVMTRLELERFAALVAAASEEVWKQAVINELVVCCIYNASHDNNPRKAIQDAISWNCQVALDPLVSSDAQELIDRGAAAEREACAKVCDEMYRRDGFAEVECEASDECAAAIRVRSEK